MRLVGDAQAVELFGVRLVGLNAINLKKLLISLVLMAAVYGLNKLLRGISHLLTPPSRAQPWVHPN